MGKIRQPGDWEVGGISLGKFSRWGTHCPDPRFRSSSDRGRASVPAGAAAGMGEGGHRGRRQCGAAHGGGLALQQFQLHTRAAGGGDPAGGQGARRPPGRWSPPDLPGIRRRDRRPDRRLQPEVCECLRLPVGLQSRGE